MLFQDPLKHADTDLPFPETRARLQRSISCTSLPEFMLVDSDDKNVLQRVTRPRPDTAQSYKSNTMSPVVLPRTRTNLRPASECEFIPNSPTEPGSPKRSTRLGLLAEGSSSENQPLLEVECITTDESPTVQYPTISVSPTSSEDIQIKS